METKQDMSKTCGFKHNEYISAVHVTHTMSAEDWDKWYSKNCANCKYMSEICMYGEE
jgi:hypothetical protein